VREVSDSASPFLDHLKEDLWGTYVIARRELWSNIKSMRSIVMIIILALIVALASVGFSGFVGEDVPEETFIYHTLAADPDGLVNDISVFVHFKDTLKPIPDRNVSLVGEAELNPELQGLTDPDGTFLFKSLTPAFHLLYVELREKDDSSVRMGMGFEFIEDVGPTTVFIIPNQTIDYPSLGVVAYQADISGNERTDDLVVHVTDHTGTPVLGAQVLLGGEPANETNAHGVATITGIEKGINIITAVSSGGVMGLFPMNITEIKDISGGMFELSLENPDEVLNLVALFGFGLFIPIYAIALCFDTIFREKLTGSIDYLLSRPMGRRAIFMGKYTGIVAAIMVPAMAVSFVGIGLIAWKTGEAPTGTVVIGFLFYTFLLISVFIFLQMIFSTLAKTTGTAVLSGIAIWIFFFLLYGIILSVIGIYSDMSSAEYERFLARAIFISPTDLYSVSISGLISTEDVGGLPYWYFPLGLFSMVVILYLLSMEIFRRKVTE
jgi:ABC-type transport system involved in multi-copper enzyme maturation permease subunit